MDDAPDSLEYPPGPMSSAPPVEVGTAYRLRVALVLASLIAFLAVYLGLVAGAGALVWVAIETKNIFIGAGGAMLLLFFVKGLFRRRRVDVARMIEIDAQSQPRLFAFLGRVAKDADAALPGKVFVSYDVNAAVMFDSSLLALVWPVRKNLVLGFGLLNALDVAELKAVLGHELGHFSQSTTRLVRYVYVANGVIADLVYGRDFWDDLLRGWQRIDLRLSFPAWILAGIVWLVRKGLALAHKGLTLASLSLGRQMELDADANAVRIAGSDAIVRGLWKSERAQLALQHAVEGLSSAAEHGKLTRDLFYHQARSLERLDAIVGKDAETLERFASILAPYRAGAELHFRPDGEQVSALWRTHPPHHEREIAAKDPYVPSPEDPRPALALVEDAPRLRRRLTKLAYRALGQAEGERLPAKEIEELIEAERGEMRQAEHYQGLYEDRFVRPGKIDAVMEKIDAAAEAGALDVELLRKKVRTFTGEKLRAKTKRLEALRDATRLASALEQGAKLAQDRAPFLGEELGAAEILRRAPGARRELDEACAELERGDRRFFKLHYALARGTADKWDLVLRYRFLLANQELIADLSRFEGPFAEVLKALGERREVTEADVRKIEEMLDAARDAVQAVVDRAAKLAVPPLQMLEERPLAEYLLSERVTPPSATRVPETKWILAVMKQHEGVIRRLRRLHFKNLGALLALTEKLAPDLFDRAPSSVRSE